MTWWLQIGGQNLDRERVRVQVAKARLTHHFLGKAMAAKATSQKGQAQEINDRLGAGYAASMRSMATQNLIKWPQTPSGVVLLALLAVRHF